MKYIKLIIATLSLVTMLSMSGAAANGLSTDLTSNGRVSASFVGDACSALSTVSSTQCSTGSNNFKGIAKTVVDILSFIIGIIAVIMIIISGFRFIIAGSDTNAVNSAKNTLIYAIVGLVIAVLAQVLVHTVLNTANNIASSANSFLNTSSSIRRDS